MVREAVGRLGEAKGGAAVEIQSDLTIVFDQAEGAEAELVRDRLDMYNVGVTGVSAYYPVHFYVKSGRGETMGGLLGGIWEAGCISLTCGSTKPCAAGAGRPS